MRNLRLGQLVKVYNRLEFPRVYLENGIWFLKRTINQFRSSVVINVDRPTSSGAIIAKNAWVADKESPLSLYLWIILFPNIGFIAAPLDCISTFGVKTYDS